VFRGTDNKWHACCLVVPPDPRGLHSGRGSCGHSG
jgi:hypothetical protein